MSELLTPRYLHKAPFELEGMALLVPDVANHPNRAAFQAVLTRIDEPSTRPPGGAQGHRVRISRAAAEAALPSLLGMAVNCSDDFSDHAKRTKIGVITEAHIDGNAVVIAGHLYEKDFAAEVAYLRQHKDRMGASYEISDVTVRDPAADIWDIDHLVFTGAALLFKDKAAYAKTSLAAHAEEETTMEKTLLEEIQMVNAKLDGISAAMEAAEDEQAARDAEAEAASHDEAASRSLAEAQRARGDADAEDAARHDEAAAASHTKAFQCRMRAAEWHAAQSAKCKAAGEDAAATQHEEVASRLRAAAEASQQAAREVTARHQVSEEGGSQQATSDEAVIQAMARMFGGEADAASEDESFARQWRLALIMAKAMTAASVGGTTKAVAKPHADEAEDKALFREMMQKMLKPKGAQQAATAPVTDLKTRRDIRELRASVELLTDTVKKMMGLLTDGAQPRSGLATDRASTTPNGGAAPHRRSLQGTGGSAEQFVDKYAGQRDLNAGKLSEAEFTKQLVA